MPSTEYETTIILRAETGGEAMENSLDKVRDAVRKRGGKLLAINHWGKKKLAYNIEKQSRGIYVHAQYLGGGDMVHEIERNLRINDAVLRFLTVRVADNIDAQTREEAAYVAPAFDADEATDEAAGADATAPSASAPQANDSEENKSEQAAAAEVES